MRTYNATLFCEPIAEEPSAGNPHAGFRGGWAAREGQPFYPETAPQGTSYSKAHENRRFRQT